MQALTGFLVKNSIPLYELQNTKITRCKIKLLRKWFQNSFYRKFKGL